MLLFLVDRVDDFVESSEASVHVVSCNSNSMVVIPVVRSLLLVWIVVDRLIRSTRFLGPITFTFQPVLCPISLRLSI